MLWSIGAIAALLVIGGLIYAVSHVNREDVDQYLIDSGNGDKVAERQRRLAERVKARKRP